MTTNMQFACSDHVSAGKLPMECRRHQWVWKFEREIRKRSKLMKVKPPLIALRAMWTNVNQQRPAELCVFCVHVHTGMHCACMYNYSFPFWKLYLDAPRMSIGSVCFLLLAASLVVVHLSPQAGVPFDICHQTCTFPTLQADTVLPFYLNKEKLWRGIGIITLHSKQPPKESDQQSSISSELFEISKINLRARQERQDFGRISTQARVCHFQFASDCPESLDQRARACLT